AEGAVQRGQPLSTTLQHMAAQAPKAIAGRINQLASDLHWLAQRIETMGTAHRLMLELERRLGYADAMSAESGGKELGQAKAVMVHAFVDLAEGKGGLDS